MLVGTQIHQGSTLGVRPKLLEPKLLLSLCTGNTSTSTIATLAQLEKPLWLNLRSHFGSISEAILAQLQKPFFLNLRSNSTLAQLQKPLLAQTLLAQLQKPLFGSASEATLA